MIRQPNRGKGAAIRAAIPYAEGEIAVIQDADMEYDPADVPELIEPIVRGAADVVFGSRLSRRPAAARVPLLAPRRQPLPLAAHERRSSTRRSPTWRRATRRSASTCCARSTCARTASGSSPRSPARSASASCASTSCRSRTTAARYDEGKKITWRDGFRAIWVLFRVRVHDVIGGKTLAVVVPAYDEEALIGETLAGIPSFVDRIFVVDDASSDATAEKARAVGDPRVEVIVHERNRGVGAAIVTGYKRALAEGIDVTVGHGRRQPDGSRRARDDRRPGARGEVDYAKANRLFTGRAWELIPRTRYLGNAVLSLLTKIASGYWHVADSQAGYTAISLATLELLDLDRVYTRYGFPNDLLVHLNVSTPASATSRRARSTASASGRGSRSARSSRGSRGCCSRASSGGCARST